jgi:hypothetical protein
LYVVGSQKVCINNWNLMIKAYRKGNKKAFLEELNIDTVS